MSVPDRFIFGEKPTTPRPDFPALPEAAGPSTTGAASLVGAHLRAGAAGPVAAGRAVTILYLALRRARRFMADPTTRETRQLVLREADDALEFARPLVLADPNGAPEHERTGRA